MYIYVHGWRGCWVNCLKVCYSADPGGPQWLFQLMSPVFALQQLSTVWPLTFDINKAISFFRLTDGAHRIVSLRGAILCKIVEMLAVRLKPQWLGSVKHSDRPRSLSVKSPDAERPQWNTASRLCHLYVSGNASTWSMSYVSNPLNGRLPVSGWWS